MSKEQKDFEDQDVPTQEAGDTVTEEVLLPEETVETKQLQEENAQLFARLQRLQADFDNYRKRMTVEKKEWFAQAACDLMRELLPVMDNMERAKTASGSVEALMEGVDLVYKQLVAVLEKQGLQTIETCGTPFDPNCHYAIMQVECDQPENTVVEELQKGYKLQERVLRPSMVKVAK